MKHELWKEMEVEQYTSASQARTETKRANFLAQKAALIRTIEANSHFEAMAAYYKCTGWVKYTTDQEWDKQPYLQEWLEP
jgi:hypothetical protein